MSGSRIRRRGCRQARGRTARSGRTWPPGTRSSTTRGPKRSNGPASCPCYLRRPRTCFAPRTPWPRTGSWALRASRRFFRSPPTLRPDDRGGSRARPSSRRCRSQAGQAVGRAGVQLRDPRHERRSTSSREGASPKRGFHLLLALPPERRVDLHGVRVSANTNRRAFGRSSSGGPGRHWGHDA